VSSARTLEAPVSEAVPAADQVALFHSALAELCRSDVPLPQALRAVADDLGSGRLAAAVREMAADVDAGAPLGEAYADRAEAMPPLYVGLVEAGVAAGDLPGVLEEIAAHAASLAESAARVRRVLAYPALAGTMAVAVGALLTFTIGPRLAALQEQASEGDLLRRADGTWLGIVASPWFAGALALALLAVTTFVVWLFATMRRPLDGAAGLDARQWKWPVLGRIRAYAQLSTLAATLSLLLRRRMPLVRAFELTAASCDEPGLRARVTAMADAADGGASLADALAKGGVVAPSLVWIIDSAERRGQAAEALADAARIYRERLARATDRAALWLLPVSELVVGGMVALVALGSLGRLTVLTSMIMGLAGRS
jgi:type II secretory pathway component PulF